MTDMSCFVVWEGVHVVVVAGHLNSITVAILIRFIAMYLMIKG